MRRQGQQGAHRSDGRHRGGLGTEVHRRGAARAARQEGQSVGVRQRARWRQADAPGFLEDPQGLRAPRRSLDLPPGVRTDLTLVLRKPDGPCALEVRTLRADGTAALSGHFPTPDGKLLAYGLADAGSDFGKKSGGKTSTAAVA